MIKKVYEYEMLDNGSVLFDKTAKYTEVIQEGDDNTDKTLGVALGDDLRNFFNKELVSAAKITITIEPTEQKYL